MIFFDKSNNLQSFDSEAFLKIQNNDAIFVLSTYLKSAANEE
jgi:hypothetical protein